MMMLLVDAHSSADNIFQWVLWSIVIAEYAKTSRTVDLVAHLGFRRRLIDKPCKYFSGIWQLWQRDMQVQMLDGEMDDEYWAAETGMEDGSWGSRMGPRSTWFNQNPMMHPGGAENMSYAPSLGAINAGELVLSLVDRQSAVSILSVYK
jgi:hypothetical protein